MLRICRVYHITRPSYMHFPPYKPAALFHSAKPELRTVSETFCTFVNGNMASKQDRAELDAKARQGETVVPGGTGGKSLEAQERLAEGRSRGGQTRREQLGHEGYQELGQRGGETRKEQMGHEGYQEMGRKGGLSTMEKSGGERAAEEGIEIDESKFRTKDR